MTKDEIVKKIKQIERRSKKYPPTQSVIRELIELKNKLKLFCSNLTHI